MASDTPIVQQMVDDSIIDQFINKLERFVLDIGGSACSC